MWACVYHGGSVELRDQLAGVGENWRANSANSPALNLSCFPHLAVMASLLNSEGLQPIPTTSAPMNTSLEHRCQDLKPTPQTHCRWAPSEQKQDPQVHWNLLTSKVTPLLAMSSHAFPQRPCWRSWSQVTHPTSASWSAFPGGMLPLLLGKNPSAFYLSSLSLQPLPPLNNNKHVWNQC